MKIFRLIVLLFVLSSCSNPFAPLIGTNTGAKGQAGSAAYVLLQADPRVETRKEIQLMVSVSIGAPGTRGVDAAGTNKSGQGGKGTASQPNIGIIEREDGSKMTLTVESSSGGGNPWNNTAAQPYLHLTSQVYTIFSRPLV